MNNDFMLKEVTGEVVENTNEVIREPIKVVSRKQQILNLLENQDIKERLASLCGSEKQRESFKANLLNIALDSNLNNCSVESIVKSALNIAGLKLSLSKNLGKAYIVSRNKKVGNSYVTEANIDIGYKGWLELAKRSKLSIKAYSVFGCDTFNFKIVNTDELLEFIPNFFDRQEHDSKWVLDNIKGIIVNIKDLKYNESSIKFVSKDTLFKIMNKSESIKRNKFSAYSEWLNEMLLAKAIKYCVSKTAMSEDIGVAVSLDNENEQDFATEKKTIKTNNFNDMMNKIRSNENAYTESLF